MATGGDVDDAGAWDVTDHILGTLYGNCVGDAIGLLTEFMTKPESKKAYQDHKDIEYAHRVKDFHRNRWKEGDWTDDSDQMILIMDMLVETGGTVDTTNFARKLRHWRQRGVSELGDHIGMGIGYLTKSVIDHKEFCTDPIKAADEIWKKENCNLASNGGVMRTSVLGTLPYKSLDTVINNAKQVCKVTHADPRCVASCVAVVSAISFMLQRQPQHMDKDGKYNTEAIIKDAYSHAKPHLEGPNYKKYKKELKHYMFTTKLSSFDLDDRSSIGYTYKTMGSGFWALRQEDFRTALQTVLLEGGDADTNGAVAGALLGCKLGAKQLPPTWRDNLLHKDWLDQKIVKFLELQTDAKPQTEEVAAIAE